MIDNIKQVSISETTRKVFFPTNSSIIKLPSSFFSQNFIITAKGLYPPSIILLKYIPTKSYSVPIKLITMPIEKEFIITKEETTPLKKSNSTPIIPTMTTSTSIPTSSNIARLKKTTLIDKLITNKDSTILKAPRPSTSTRTASQATVQVKSSNSIKLIHKKKKTTSPPPQPTTEEEEEDIPLTKPISLTEKRKRQAKRADQIKIYKVREEREAREARSVMRKKLMNANVKKPVEVPTPPLRKKKKRVKFDFNRNSVIQLE